MKVCAKTRALCARVCVGVLKWPGLPYGISINTGSIYFMRAPSYEQQQAEEVEEGGGFPQSEDLIFKLPCF